MGATSSHSYVPVPTREQQTRNNENELSGMGIKDIPFVEMKSYIETKLVPPKNKLLLDHPNDSYTFLYNTGVFDDSFLLKKSFIMDCKPTIPTKEQWMSYSCRNKKEMRLVNFDVLTGFTQEFLTMMYQNIFCYQSFCLKKNLKISVRIMFKRNSGANDFNCRTFDTHNETINFLSRLNLFIQENYNIHFCLPEKDFVDETGFFEDSNDGIIKKFEKYSEMTNGRKLLEEISNNIRYRHDASMLWTIVLVEQCTCSLTQHLNLFLQDVQKQLLYEKYMVKVNYQIYTSKIVYYLKTYDELRKIEKAIIRLIQEEIVKEDDCVIISPSVKTPPSQVGISPPVEEICLSNIDKEI